MREQKLPAVLDQTGHFSWDQREKIRKLFEKEVFGAAPPYEGGVSATLRYKEAYPGLGSKEVMELTLKTPKGPYTFPLYVYYPEQAAVGKPAPLILYIGNRPRADTPMTPPPDMTPDRMQEILMPVMDAFPGAKMGAEQARVVVRGCDLDHALELENWPVEDLLRQGYITAAYYTEDLEPDRCTDGCQGIMDRYAGEKTHDLWQWGAIAAWAFGASRALDYLTQDRRISQNIAVAGHSRGGKTALWCAANDPRITCCYANDSGCTGAAISRGKRGERLLQINSIFPYWFCEEYKKYNGHEENLPIDQHMLLALVAPRLLYLASATEDLWSDPQAEFAGAAAASAAYDALGVPGLMCSALPEPGHPCHAGRIGYHTRKGGHDLTREDWHLFCDFWRSHL